MMCKANRFFGVFTLSVLLLSNPSFAAQPSVATYDQLLSAIRETRAASQVRIEQAVDQEKVREAWETGKLIDEHILLHKERANYGEQVMKRLSKDLSTNDRELYYMREFYRAYSISLPGAKLSWSHYKALLDVKKTEEREEMKAEAVQNNWTRDQVRAEVRRRNSSSGSPERPLEKLAAKQGKPGTYRIVKAEAGPDKGELVIDLGFSNYFRFGDMSKFKEGDLVQAAPLKTLKPGMVSYQFTKQDKISAAGTSQDESLFTYKAYVTEVIDGDTFDAVVDLGFAISTKQKLRLRGLDAPEIISAEGREAKAFLEKHFAQTHNEILIKTSKSDKYDRYLVDVWYAPARDDKISAGRTQATGLEYLNQALLDAGLAILVED